MVAAALSAELVPALQALGEPTRFRLVDELRGGPRRVSDLADALSVPQPQVSKHLRVLKEAGWVSVAPVAQERVYALVPAHFVAFARYLEGYRQLWSERHAQLDALLGELQSSSSSSPPSTSLTSSKAHPQKKEPPHDRRRRRR